MTGGDVVEVLPISRTLSSKQKKGLGPFRMLKQVKTSMRAWNQRRYSPGQPRTASKDSLSLQLMRQILQHLAIPRISVSHIDSVATLIYMPAV